MCDSAPKLALTTRDLMEGIPCSKSVALRLMRQLGVRISENRRVVPVARWEQWLEAGGIDGAGVE